MHASESISLHAHSPATDVVADASRPAAAPAATSVDPRDIAHFLARHAAICPRCRYSLHGLGADRCPECGGLLALGIVAPDYDPAASLKFAVPFSVAVVGSLVGAAFSTYVRGEHDDWIVGITIAAAAGALIVPAHIFTKRLNLLPRTLGLAVFINLWVVTAGLLGLAFFLDI